MRKFSFSISSCLAGIAALGCIGSAWAAPARDIPKQILDGAIRVTLTDRGQNFFARHLTEVLLANGFDFDDGEFASWKYVASEPIRLDNLPMNMNNGIRTTLGSLRDLIQKWLLGFQLNDPKLTVLVKGIRYSSNLIHFGFRVDQESTQALGQPNALVVDLQIEIPSLAISADRISMTDADNRELGEMAMNSFSAKTLPTLNPQTGQPVHLKFQVPLELWIDPDTGLNVRALTIQTNLPLLNLDWSYARPLQLPKIDVSINGQQMQVNYSQFEDELNAKRHELAKALQTYLKNYLAESGAGMINSILQKNHVASIIEDLNSIAPLNAPARKKVQAFLWGMVPAGLGIDPDGDLEASLNAFVEDPQAAHLAGPPSEHANGDPDLSSYPDSSFDFVLSINEGFINRMLRLSFNRGYFKNMKFDGKTITLTGAPYFKLDSSIAHNQAKVHVSVDENYVPQNWKERIEMALAVKNPVHVSFDLLSHFKVNPVSGEVTLIMDRIDLNSVKLDPNSVKYSSFFFNRVLSAVKAQLSAINQSVAKKATRLAAPFEVPRAAMGIPLKLKAVQSDSTGHFNVFAELKK